MNAQKATEIRRRLSDVERERAALRLRQAELEKYLLAATAAGRDPRRQKIIAGVLADFRRLSGDPEVANDPP